MSKKEQKGNRTLIFPFGIVTGILLGIVFLLFSYIYGNYFSSAAEQHPSASTQHEVYWKNHS
ncbi:hypothetical protein [Pantoea sp. Ep11b]|uniref:hypothetical protein n=1 Tax=unclassified Pantoea TaxID=2630326 RepID=UPI00345FAB63